MQFNGKFSIEEEKKESSAYVRKNAKEKAKCRNMLEDLKMLKQYGLDSSDLSLIL